MREAALTILVAVDDTLPSMHAVRYAVRLCHEAGERARLHLCHVLPPAQALRGSTLPAPPPPAQDGFLLEAQAEAHCGGIEPTIEMLRGDPASQLLERARSLGADLLVIGNARRGSLADALRGTPGLESLHAAPCPIVLTP